MTASSVVRHARGRHRSATRVDSAAAVLSRVLEPEAVVVVWTATHPECVVLPLLAAFLALGQFTLIAVVFAGAGIVVIGLVLWRESVWRKGLPSELDEDKKEPASCGQHEAGGNNRSGVKDT